MINSKFFVGKSMISWAEAGSRSPVDNVSTAYLRRSCSSLASSSYFFLRSSSNLFASYYASFLFLGGILNRLL